MKTLTKEQINKKYKGYYVEMLKTYDYEKKKSLYEIKKISKTIRENMTLCEDV
jgi:hypothetical protein